MTFRLLLSRNCYWVELSRWAKREWTNPLCWFYGFFFVCVRWTDSARRIQLKVKEIHLMEKLDMKGNNRFFWVIFGKTVHYYNHLLKKKLSQWSYFVPQILFLTLIFNAIQFRVSFTFCPKSAGTGSSNPPPPPKPVQDKRSWKWKDGWMLFSSRSI